MSWTDPPTFVAGDALTAAQLNAYLTANENYLKAASDAAVFSGVQADITSSQSIASGSDTLISFSRTVIDVDNWWTSGTNITVPAAAIPSGYTNIVVHVVGIIRFASNGTGRRRADLLQNGSAAFSFGVTAVNGDQTYTPVECYLSAASGDVFTLQVFQNSGGSLNCEVANLTIVRFAPLS